MGRIAVRRLNETRKGETDWKRIDALTDADIVNAVQNDPDTSEEAANGLKMQRCFVRKRTSVCDSLASDSYVLHHFYGIAPTGSAALPLAPDCRDKTGGWYCLLDTPGYLPYQPMLERQACVELHYPGPRGAE